MLILGLVLIVVAAALIVLGLFTTGNGDLEDPIATMLGLPVGATSIFVVGLAAGVLVMLGLWLMKWGGKRQAKSMKERREMRKIVQSVHDAEQPKATDEN